MKKFVMTDEQVKELDKMIWKIVMYKKLHYIEDPADVHSECWLTAMEIINKRNEIDYNYIASACFNKIAEIARKSCKSDAVLLEDSIYERLVSFEERSTKFAKGGVDDSSDYRTVEFLTNPHFDAPGEKLELLEILDLFNDNEKAKEMVRLWMKILGIISEEKPERLPEKALEGWIAKELGYSGSSSMGYARLRAKVRDRLVNAGYYVPEWMRGNN